MQIKRRDFLQKVGLASAGLALWPYLNSSSSFFGSNPLVLLPDIHNQVKSPVKIASIEVVRVFKRLFVRSTSTEGAVGLTMANERMEYLIPILKGLVAPYFIGKDARDLIRLVDGVYKHDHNYKYAGMPFSNCVGHVELSLWDMLGKIAQKPSGRFFGKAVRIEVPMYLSSLTRETKAEEEIEFLVGKLAETGAKAVKLKVGGRSTSKENVPGRSKAIIPLARKVFGDDISIYVDANSSYTVEEGIEIGKMLEDYGVAIFEEPCSWEDTTSNKKVADALNKLILAGGEQDSSLYRFQYLVDNRVYDLIQPDLFYNGGLIRCIQVANMAAKVGRGVAPHSPKADPLEAAMLQFAAVVPNLEGFQEFPSKAGKQPDWYSPKFLIKDGKMQIPAGNGLGVTYDAGIWAKEEKL